VICDEGSALLRLFKQVYNLEEDISEEFEYPISGNIIDDLETLSIKQIDTILNNDIKEINSLDFSTESTVDQDYQDEQQPNINVDDDDDDYDLINLNDPYARPIVKLEIELGTNKLPRFSCACHKTNLAVRKAIKTSKAFVNALAALNNFASKKKTTNKVKVTFNFEFKEIFVKHSHCALACMAVF
jgi:hypothetical protein